MTDGKEFPDKLFAGANPTELQRHRQAATTFRMAVRWLIDHQDSGCQPCERYVEAIEGGAEVSDAIKLRCPPAREVQESAWDASQGRV